MRRTGANNVLPALFGARASAATALHNKMNGMLDVFGAHKKKHQHWYRQAWQRHQTGCRNAPAFLLCAQSIPLAWRACASAASASRRGGARPTVAGNGRRRTPRASACRSPHSKKKKKKKTMKMVASKKRTNSGETVAASASRKTNNIFGWTTRAASAARYSLKAWRGGRNKGVSKQASGWAPRHGGKKKRSAWRRLIDRCQMWEDLLRRVPAGTLDGIPVPPRILCASEKRQS